MCLYLKCTSKEKFGLSQQKITLNKIEKVKKNIFNSSFDILKIIVNSLVSVSSSFWKLVTITFDS